jgi:hypothetical protein
MRGGSESGRAMSVLRSKPKSYPNFGTRGRVGDRDGSPTHDLDAAKERCWVLFTGV